MTDQFTVDRKEYLKRADKRRRVKNKRVLVTVPRKGTWTPEEDVIVLRDDIFPIEKIAMLQRDESAISNRRRILLYGERKQCPSCKREFVGFPGQQCCSKQCSVAAARADFEAQWTRPCPVCGTLFVAKYSNGGRQQFCSKPCLLARSAANRRADTAARNTRTCSQCGTDFIARSYGNGRRQEQCSDLCRLAAGVERKLARLGVKTCQACGVQFRPDRKPEQRFCSTQCVHAARVASAAKRNTRDCPSCGTAFVGKTKSKYCSLECARRGSSLTAAERQATRTHCRHGHELTEDNKRYYDGTKFDCRTCARFVQREAATRKRTVQRAAKIKAQPQRICAAFNCTAAIPEHVTLKRKFCSDACAYAEKKKQDRDKAAAERAARPPKPPRLCSIDGCDTEHTARGLCSKHYQQAHKNGPARSCQQCGGEFRAWGAQRRFCSTECSKVASIKNPPRLCLVCGTKFKPAHAISKTCSRACGVELTRTIRPRPCKQCGTQFKPTHDRGAFCSKACVSAAMRGVPVKGNRKRGLDGRWYPVGRSSAPASATA